MMHYTGNLQAAIQGNIQALKAVPFSAIGEQAGADAFAGRLSGAGEHAGHCGKHKGDFDRKNQL